MWLEPLSSCNFPIANLLIACAVSAPAAAQSPLTDAGAVLAGNRTAVGDDGKPATLDARFIYSGQGLTGQTRDLSDRASGAYLGSYDVGPTHGASGYDGRMAWMQDLSGAYTPQDGGDRPAIAVNKAYRNANLWWHADRGGAVVAFKGREIIDGAAAYHLVVSPRGGKAFDAWFDAATLLLMRVDEQQQFLTITTRYRDFARQHGLMVAHTVTVDSGTGPAGLQTMKLTRFDIGPARPLSTYSRPVEAPTGAAIDGGAVETIVSNSAGQHRPDPDRMFDRFYRADPSRSAAAGGVGLGLSISRELAAAMKGRLWADFDDSGNLRMHLMLPASRDVKVEPDSGAAAVA